MKKNINLLIVFASFLFVTFANAEIVFQDTFNNVPGSGDINMSNTVAGRQFGKIIPLSYSTTGFNEIGDTAISPNKLTLTNNATCSPDYNFMDSDNFTIELDVVELPTGWLGIMLGKNAQNIWPITAGGLGILLEPGGGYQIWDGESGYGHGSALPAVPYHLLISVSMENSSSTKIAVFANGVPLQMGAVASVGSANPFIFSKASGFKYNYLTLYNLGDGKGVIDNLTIRSTTSKFYEYEWTNDASSKIDSTKTYTHKINLGNENDVTINGELFTGSGTNISGAGWSIINGYGDNNFAGGTVGNPEITGAGTNLVTNFLLDSYSQSSAIILSNLTPEAMYCFTLYNRGYAGNRQAYFAPGDSESSMVTLDQNISGNAGRLVKYIYEAPSNGVFSMVLKGINVTNTWLFYAFSNELSPPPTSANISASRGDFSDKIIVNWDTVIDADKYQVWRNDSDDSSSAIAISTELTETVFTDTTATVNLDYYYWVKAENTNGWGDFSQSAIGFSTDSTGPVKPTNVLPVNGADIFDLPVTLDGSAYSDASWSMESVEWQISDDTNYNSITWDSGEISTNATSIIAPSGPLVSTNYWRVRYKNNRNKWSDWSDYTSFTVERDYDSPFYFYETFNNVSGNGDVNKDYYVTGRQLGSAAPVDYVLQGTTVVGDSATNPDKLTLSGEDASCSPNMSFSKYKNLKIEIDIEPSANGSAICFGKITKNAKPESPGGMAFVFYGDGSGRYEIFNSETLVGIFTNDAVKASPFHLQISVTDDDGNELIAAFIDNKPLVLYSVFFVQPFHSNHFDYVYERGGSFLKNYITLYNLGGSSKFDNLQIQKTTTNLNVFTWTDDADSRIDSANNYTHAVNLNTVGNIDINGVTFIGSGTSVVYGLNPVGAVHQRFVQNGTAGLNGSNWVISAADDLFETDSDWTPPGNNLPAEGNNLLNHFLFSSWDGVEIRLNNLTPGSSNVFAMHFFEWAEGFEMPIAASDGGVPQNISMNIGSPGNGLIFEYKYKASEDGTFSFTISKVQHPLFSFCNYETTTPEPYLYTINSLDFGEVVQGESKTFQLPVFNFGAGIVSGNVNGITAPFSLYGGSDYSAQSDSPDFVNITFSPLAEGEYSNTISLIGSGGNIQVELKGVGIPECGIVFSILFSVFGIWRKLIPTENTSG